MISEHQGGEGERENCPRCKSEKVWRDGIRKDKNSEIQRFICRECGYRFSDSHYQSALSSSFTRDTSCQVCDQLDGSKNLIVVPENGTTGEISEKKSLLLRYSLYQKKQGYAESTILTRTRQIDVLMKRGANIYDPESVKETIASQTWVNKRKQNVVDAYSTFLQMLGKTWNPPFY